MLEKGMWLHELSVGGRWQEMPALVADDVVRIFACGIYQEIARDQDAVRRRSGFDRSELPAEYAPERVTPFIQASTAWYKIQNLLRDPGQQR
jgi:hypothetical protein